jgi:hypothetical protein
MSRSTKGCEQGTYGGLEFVNLENSQVRLPAVRLEEGIMIGAEVPRDALTVNGGVEQAAQVDARDGPRVHADAHEATSELIHDHEHPLGPQHERFAAKEVDAPEAGSGVSNQRQPRRPVPSEEGR